MLSLEEPFAVLRTPSQVLIFFTQEYVAYGSSCADVSVARVRVCQDGGKYGDWTPNSAGTYYTRCYVQCPPPVGREVVASYSPGGSTLGLGAVMNRTMFASSVEGPNGTCAARVLQRTCGVVSA